jgi:uncharacterized membrane protein affecting hemolysin expression
MGFLEVCVDVLQLSDNYNITSATGRLFTLLVLVAAIFLARILKPPRKDDWQQ